MLPWNRKGVFQDLSISCLWHPLQLFKSNQSADGSVVPFVSQRLKNSHDLLFSIIPVQEKTMKCNCLTRILFNTVCAKFQFA